MDPREITPRVIATLDGRAVGAVVPSLDGKRIYFSSFGKNQTDTLWLLDPATKRTKRIAEGFMGNLALSPTNDQLVFFRGMEDGKLTMIWTLPLDPKTGEATGPARRLSMNPGDQPRVSPDGKWVAYAVYDSVAPLGTQHLGIIPSSGGTERVVVRTDGGIGKIEWSQDEQSLVFVQLTNRGGAPQFRQVAAAGGVPTPMFSVVSVAGNAPGLSPDGRLIFVPEAGRSQEVYTLFDRGGTRLGRVSVPRPFGVRTWLNATTVMLATNAAPQSVRVVSLADGSAREILPSSISARNVFWSPDGKRAATIGVVSNRATLFVVNADGSGRRAIGAGAEIRGDNLWWSPDGKFITTHAPAGQRINVIDVATGAVRRIGAAGQIGQMQWRSDARAVFYTSNAAVTGGARGIREATLDGRDREVYGFSFGGAIGMRNDEVALASMDSGAFLVSTRTGALTKLSTYRVSGVVTERGAQRFALRRLSQNRADNEIEIVDPAGKRLARLEFTAFNVGPAATSTFFFHPDGKHLVLAGESNGRRALYMVPIAGGEPRKIADLPNSDGAPGMDLSPDGKHVVFTVAGPESGQIATLDLSSFTRR